MLCVVEGGCMEIPVGRESYAEEIARMKGLRQERVQLAGGGRGQCGQGWGPQ